ncbi:hypothetical protein Y032_0428g1279 [Ancylostoma ceylanicum]|uniref:Uncharacterized protein n=1 Tax=Ancylostoma ceylanicum TaxID=53326 RepID=A0A016X0M4_9BILA|nr:hypothetical protein Y032_0428g1279 [Ancylostoma ceylanicum]
MTSRRKYEKSIKSINRCCRLNCLPYWSSACLRTIKSSPQLPRGPVRCKDPVTSADIDRLKARPLWSKMIAADYRERKNDASHIRPAR